METIINVFDVHTQSLSFCLTLCDCIDTNIPTPQVPPSMKFSGNEYQSEFHGLSLEIFLTQEYEPTSPLSPTFQEKYLSTELLGNLLCKQKC